MIDPVIEWATYLGGSLDDGVYGLAADASGNIIACGLTESPDFDTTTGVIQENLAGNYDWFVTALDPTGESILWSTYLGGNGVDVASDVAGVTASGRASAQGDSPAESATG